ncbi:DUF5906 domain-containing protein [Flavobacterium sp. MDT1-60]|uniref:DUF5906 domain-containing protein n=1 Tax=Flavobacterium sp. MDT1-60 TaxID=1979344 RepID=UPI001781A36C|nr:DUF5906 domain-containing protein [Flavobacterium sp. MDT1-60]QOG03491.1 hypothetical protein IHE43_04405 [Flavobacterium sp. MDT1-60]
MRERVLESTDRPQFYSEIQVGNGVKIEIKQSKMIEFWESKGYRNLKMPKGGYQLVKIKNKSIISEAVDEELMHEVKNQLLNIEEKFNVWTEFVEKDFITKKTKLALDILKEINLNICNAKTAYFFFSNGVLKVTEDEIELIPYEEYGGYVFESQIINHDFVLVEESEKLKSDFDAFLRNVTNNKEDRYNYLTTAIGYIIHGFKDSSLTKAVILVDETLDFSGEANGGTGKSIIGRAVSSVTSTLTKDGKSLNTKGNRFFYQDLNYSHKVMYLDDVNEDLNFEDFYSVVTGSLSIEEKHKAPYSIPFEISPKLMISSNYMVKGSGGNSDERRRIEIEIFPYYSKDFTPLDDFGKKLFDDWDVQEYNSFFNDMISYCQKFMCNGIMNSAPINLNENKLILETNMSFVEFADMNITFNSGEDKISKNKATLYNHYRDKYPMESRNVSNVMFKKWLAKWSKRRGYEDSHRKSDGQSIVDFFRKIDNVE